MLPRETRAAQAEIAEAAIAQARERPDVLRVLEALLLVPPAKMPGVLFEVKKAVTRARSAR